MSVVIRAFVAVASRTRSAIWAIRLVAVTAVAFRTKEPERFNAPAAIFEPKTISSGTDSPVISELSSEPNPSTTMPSTATRSPAATTTRSPLTTALAWIVL